MKGRGGTVERGWEWGRGLSMRMIVGVRVKVGRVGCLLGRCVKRNNSKPSRVYQSKGGME